MENAFCIVSIFLFPIFNFFQKLMQHSAFQFLDFHLLENAFCNVSIFLFPMFNFFQKLMQHSAFQFLDFHLLENAFWIVSIFFFPIFNFFQKLTQPSAFLVLDFHFTVKCLLCCQHFLLSNVLSVQINKFNTQQLNFWICKIMKCTGLAGQEISKLTQ